MKLYLNSGKLIALTGGGHNLFERRGGPKKIKKGLKIIKSEKPGIGGQKFCQIYHTRERLSFLSKGGKKVERVVQNICHVIMNSTTPY